MTAHFSARGTLALLAAIVTGTTVAAVRPAIAPRSPTAAGAQLRVFGTRSVQQRQSGDTDKLDSTLADLMRHAAGARPGHALEDLHSMSPAAHFLQGPTETGPLVLIDAVTRGDPQRLENVLTALGLQHASVYSNDVSGWLPVARLSAAAASADVHAIRASMFRTRAGAITSQGDFAQHSAKVRTAYSSLSGSGVTVGILSDSYDCYAAFAANKVPASGNAGYASNGFLATAANDMTTGDLPSSVTLVSTPPPAAGQLPIPGEAPCMSGSHYNGYPTYLPFGDEGRAMMQVVHDVAPGAQLAFHSAEYGEADFASGIVALANAGAKIIADDVGFFDEPFFQDGIISQAIDSVAATGVAYFSAAGNSADNAWESTSPSFGTLSNSGPNVGEYLLNFDTTGQSLRTSLPVTITSHGGLSPGELIAVIVEWDQPYVTGAPKSGGATSHINLCISGNGADQITDIDGNSTACTGANASGKDPVQILIIDNPANASGSTAAVTINITIGLADGTAPPGRIKLIVADDGAGAAIDSSLATHSSTLQGHPGDAHAAALGAAHYYNTPACGVSPAVIASYSALGGTPILFDSSGTPLKTPAVREKPDFVGPDGINTTFFGFTLAAGTVNSSVPECANSASYPSFFGTSAATPHAAGIAALMLQANPAVTAAQMVAALQSTALPMGNTSTVDGVTYDFRDGHGFIQADAALAALPPAAPTLTVSPTSVTAGQTVTLTWSSINTTGCTASGSWSGSEGTNGSTSVTAPSTAGTAPYTLTCSNAVASAATTANLMVTAPAGKGGGGALGVLTALVLAALGLVRLLRAETDYAVWRPRHRGRRRPRLAASVPREDH